jgi:hypothetical protein
MDADEIHSLVHSKYAAHQITDAFRTVMEVAMDRGERSKGAHDSGIRLLGQRQQHLGVEQADVCDASPFLLLDDVKVCVCKYIASVTNRC